MKIKLFEMFSGYGGASFGLKKARIDYECIGYSEIEPNTIKCYEQNHEGIPLLGSVVDINPIELEDFDLLTGGFPCQDVSIAGNRDLNKGRTTLFNEIIRIAEVKKPRWMLLENVEGLLSAKAFWQHVKSELSRIGYSIRYKLLYSKDYGIPQNRPRLWILCDREGFEPFIDVFPKKQELKFKLKDLLEENVDESYYLTPKNYESMIKSLKNRSKGMNSNLDRDVALTLTCGEPKRHLHDSNIVIHSKKPRTSTTEKGDSRHSDGITYTTNSQYLEFEDNKFRVLTEKECFRLMGFLHDEINLEGISKSKKYHLAGNGWDINLVSKIFETWIKPQIMYGKKEEFERSIKKRFKY